MVGKTIKHYKVLEKIGQGGMGEVYRAEDTTLKREVAIKVLPEQFTRDPQRLARFEREAQLLASLNHPNIAAIHSFEHSDDMHFLVLELVPGETLQERVAKGPLPIEEALEVCRQIAEGVEAAHEKGVIHRDLKPANVKVTPEGKVKILDFGLAKAFEDEVPVTDISQSPTLTEEMTRAGMILGTAAYMSPEQARGKPVDKRADIFAFGAVLYELLTGKRAFEGEAITETIASVLKSEPDWEKLPSDTPWRIKELLEDCLQKEVRDRPHDISHTRIQIKKALKEPTTVSPIGMGSATRTSQWKMVVPWIATVLMGVVAFVLWNLGSQSTPQRSAVSRFTTLLSARYAVGTASRMDLSPDGRQFVYVGFRAGVSHIYHRAVDQLEASPIDGTEEGRSPFLSPDGQWVGFVVGNTLKKVSLFSGGAPITLFDADFPISSGSWGADGNIILGSIDGLFRVSGAGGIPESVTTVDTSKGETGHDHPEILPGNQAVLFTVAIGETYNDYQIDVLSLDTGERKTVIEGGASPRYSPTGHLLYVSSETLMAAPFDLAMLEVTDDPIPVLGGLSTSQTGAPHLALSAEGTLVYLSATGTGHNLVWVDRQGKEQPLTEIRRTYETPRLSPDGKQLAVTIRGNNTDVWVYDLGRGTLTRLTFQPGEDETPVWTPDGKRVTFSSVIGGTRSLRWKAADGSGAEEQLLAAEYHRHIGSWSPDGTVLAFQDEDPTTGWDIWYVSLEGDHTAEPFLSTRFDEEWPMFSPDGRWIAYVSNESGNNEIYVQPFPGPGGKQQVSIDGGEEPTWSPKGNELFYRSGDKMMVVAVELGPTFTQGTPQMLFDGMSGGLAGRPNFAVTADGQRFVMVKEEEEGAAQVTFVLNWFEELKRLVPTDN